MKTEAKTQAPKAPEVAQVLPAQAAAPKREKYPFYIVPPPPIPGQTGWSIVPW